jgi:hypothetical protein
MSKQAKSELASLASWLILTSQLQQKIHHGVANTCSLHSPLLKKIQSLNLLLAANAKRSFVAHGQPIMAAVKMLNLFTVTQIAYQ